MAENKKPSLFKQLLGAGIGAGVALAVYGVYTAAEPHLQAWLTVPQAWWDGAASDTAYVNDATEDSDRVNRIAERTRRTIQEHAGQPSEYVDNRQEIRRRPGFYAQTSSSAPMEVAAHMAAPGEPPAPPTMEELQNEWDALAPKPEAETMTPPPVMESEPMYETTPPSTMTANVMSTAPGLPSSGFGLGTIGLSALGSALFLRKRKSS